MPSTVFLTRDGKLDEDNAAAFKALVGRLAFAKKNVLLHLHGGLVSQKNGEATASRLAGPAPDGFGLGNDWEQIYVVWRTGTLETLKTNWTDLFDNDRVYDALLNKLLELTAKKVGLPGGTGRAAFAPVNLSKSEIAKRLKKRPAGNPFADIDKQIERDKPSGRGPTVTAQSEVDLQREFELALGLDTDLASAADDMTAALSGGPAAGRGSPVRGNPAAGKMALDHLDAKRRTELSKAKTAPRGRVFITSAAVLKFLVKHGAAIGVRIVRRFRTKRDHGFYPTVIEELVREMYGDLIGSAIWGMMKKDASDHFGPKGFGGKLLAALQANPPPRLAITAHSAGSIWASAMITAMGKAPKFPDLRVAFLAPAVRVDFFADAIEEGGSNIDAFRMFTMKDELERRDALLGKGKGFIYPCSLLYLVSGLFEELEKKAFPDSPLVGMQRFLVKDHAWLADAAQSAAVDKILSFLAAANDRAIYSTVNGGPGRSSNAQSHGAFDDDRKTLESLRVFIS